jgi:GTP cyclohydrolase I
MKTTYEFNARAVCPVDGTLDDYVVTVKTDRFIAAEEIVSIVQGLASKPLYQENLTEDIAQRLNVAVKTVGMHSDIKTTCEVGS